ncbi:ABC transporter substrate-binding protein, partial [Acinetobacter baumannii]
SSAFAADTPKKGGTLRLGMEGGSASDSLDPRTYADSVPISYGWQIWNGLVEIDENGDPVGELAESWEAKPGATSWIFNIRKG